MPDYAGVPAAWHKRSQGQSPSRRSREEQALLFHIRAAHRRSRGTYGSPRVHQELKASGVFCGIHRVARVMRKHQVTA